MQRNNMSIMREEATRSLNGNVIKSTGAAADYSLDSVLIIAGKFIGID